MKKRIYKSVKWLLMVMTVAFIVFVIQLLLVRRQENIIKIYPQNGELDISDCNILDEVYEIDNSWEYYPNKLYTPDDFLNNVPKEGEQTLFDNSIKYGTHHLVIYGKPGMILSVCGYSVNYSSYVYVNGEIVYKGGVVADNEGKSVPHGGFMTYPLYFDENGKAEIVCQYSNFVHNDGGNIKATYVSSPQNIEKYKRNNTLVSLTLSGALLMFFLYFFVNGVFQIQLRYICLAFCCLVMSFRDQLFFSDYIMPENISWYLLYRLYIIIMILLPVSLLLLLRSLYSFDKKYVTVLYLCGIFVFLMVIVGIDTKSMSTICNFTYFYSIPYLIYLCYTIIRHFLKNKKIDITDVFVILGYSILLITLITEALLERRIASVTQYGISPIGMIIFVFVISVAISINIREKEKNLVLSQNRIDMLNSINKMNVDFFHKVAHEIKTPLAVISGYSQLAVMEIAADNANSETIDNLETIQKEVLRLSDLVTKLMKYSDGEKDIPFFSNISIEKLINLVHSICFPLCLIKNNIFRLLTNNVTHIYGNEELLLQVIINLVMNANRHTENGTIIVNVTENNDFVLFDISDNGSGIDKEILPYIFEKGFSGDKSSGLGLTICRDAVEIQGGSIYVKNTDDTGTTICFSILKRRVEDE